MSAVVVEAGIEPVHESIWTRVQRTLSNWGQKIKGAAIKAGNFITRAAKWLWNTRAVQWTVSKVELVASKAWHVLRGPVGWVTAPIAAIIFAPKAAAIMLFMIVAAMGLVLYGLYRLGKAKRSDETNEEFAERVTNKIADVIGIERPLDLDEAETPPLDPEETLQTRKAYLDELYRQVDHTIDPSLYSSLVGRIHFLEVRGPIDTKLAPGAKPDQIYRDAKEMAKGMVAAKQVHRDFKWDWTRMRNAIFSEDKRLRETAKLKAEQANLTSV